MSEARNPVPTQTARLRLDRWDEEHAALLVRLASSQEVMRHVGSGQIWPRRLAEEVAARQREHWIQHGFGWRAAVEKETGRAIGLMALNLAGEGTAGLDPSEHEIGWWLEPSAWGRGLAREGGEALCREALEALGAPSVIARIQPGNVRSAAVAESLGLRLQLETHGAGGEPISVYRLDAADWRSRAS